MPKLDDTKTIKDIDKSDALGVAASQHQQLLYSDFNFDTSQFKDIDNVVVVGMGGSALAALICRNWWGKDLQIPFVVTRDYSLPGFVNQNTLVIVSSYSGNTEETVSALEDAASKDAQIVCVSSDGKLQEISQDRGYLYLPIPEGLQPRMAVWYAVKILASIFDSLKLTGKTADQLQAAQPQLQAAAEKLLPAVKTENNLAKQIAEQIHGKTAVVYSGPTLGAAAYKWKISFNESSKNLAWSNEFPEFNHNEFMGWSAQSAEAPFQVVQLQSNLDHPQIKKRFDTSNDLLAGKMAEPIVVEAQGETNIEQLLWTIQLGDFVSLYLAVLNGVDPTPVDLIEELKKKLA